MYVDEQDKKLQERMKSEGKVMISKSDFLGFVEKYFLEQYNLNGNFDFIEVSYKFFDKDYQIFSANEGRIVNRPQERKVRKDVPSFITKEGYEKLKKLGIIYEPGFPAKINIPGLIKKEDMEKEVKKILNVNDDELVIITREMMENILKENGYSDIFYDHYYYSIMDRPSYNIYAKPIEKEENVSKKDTIIKSDRRSLEREDDER